MTIIINYFSCNQFVFHLCIWHRVPRDYFLGKFPWGRRCDSWHLFLIGRASWILRMKGVESGRCYCQTAHHATWPYIAFIKLRLIWSATDFWSIIELLIGNNQGRCDRHAWQLYGSVAGNSGDIFFATCFRQFMIFCAKFYFSAQMATMAIGNADPDR